MDRKKLLLFFCGGLLIVTALGYAGEKQAADYYAPRYAAPLAAKPLKDIVSRAIAFPFEMIRWPIDKTLHYTEKYRLDKKSMWAYDKSVEYGVTPRLDSLGFTKGPFYGVEFDLLRMVRQRERFPDMIARSWVNHGPASHFQVGGELGSHKVAGTGFHASGIFGYDNRRNETFYGIGPNTSRGDSTSFIEERGMLGATSGYEFSPTLDLTAQIAYDHVNIKNRAHDGKGDITQIFADKDIPGLHGDDLLGLSLKFERDTREKKEDATKGSYQKLLFKFTEGVNSSPARYLTYQIDTAKYFQLASPGRVLVTRFFGEFNQTVNDGIVPFYEMAKLGGTGTFPRKSQTSRAFVYNRFFGESAMVLSLEYRYPVWQYKEFKMKAAFFLDEGQVSKDFATFRIKDFKESYGMGFYLTYSQFLLLNFTVAHGDEGTQLYLENKMPF